MNWGILATGTIANKFATTVNAMAAEGERLAAVGSRRAESAKAFAAQYNIPHWHASYEELAADPAVDAIYIATPNALHYENCKLCLEHSKHVLCEKPFTINAEQAKELYALAEKKQLFIMEAFWIRFLPLYAKLQQMLAELERQRKVYHWGKENWKFIPHPATWLNQRRWEDETIAAEDDIPDDDPYGAFVY